MAEPGQADPAASRGSRSARGASSHSGPSAGGASSRSGPSGAGASSDSGSGRALGLIGSARATLENVLRILQTRGELLATEIQEEQARLASLLGLAFVAVLCLSLGVILTTLLVVVAFWDSYRLLAILILALVFLLTGGGCVVLLMQRARRRPVLFSTSLKELERDRDSLRGAAREST